MVLFISNEDHAGPGHEGGQGEGREGRGKKANEVVCLRHGTVSLR